MRDFSQSLENAMAANLSGANVKLASEESAINHLEKAHNILINAGFEEYASDVGKILYSYASIGDIEVEL